MILITKIFQYIAHMHLQILVFLFSANQFFPEQKYRNILIEYKKVSHYNCINYDIKLIFLNL